MGRPRREKDNQSPEESAAEPLILRSNPCAFTVVTAPPTLSGEGMRGRETQRHGSRDSRAAVRRLRSEKEDEEKMTMCVRVTSASEEHISGARKTAPTTISSYLNRSNTKEEFQASTVQQGIPCKIY